MAPSVDFFIILILYIRQLRLPYFKTLAWTTQLLIIRAGTWTQIGLEMVVLYTSSQNKRAYDLLSNANQFTMAVDNTYVCVLPIFVFVSLDFSSSWDLSITFLKVVFIHQPAHLLQKMRASEILSSLLIFRRTVTRCAHKVS